MRLSKNVTAVVLKLLAATAALAIMSMINAMPRRGVAYY